MSDGRLGLDVLGGIRHGVWQCLIMYTQALCVYERCFLVSLMVSIWDTNLKIKNQIQHEVKNWDHSVCDVKKMLFPGFHVSPVMLFVGKIAENGPKMCHVWLQ